jgi:hypothetical protein
VELRSLALSLPLEQIDADVSGSDA